MDVDRGSTTYTLKILKSAVPLLLDMKRTNRHDFDDMMASIRELATHDNLFSVNGSGCGLNLCHSYPHGFDSGILRFKRVGGAWRCALSVVEDGVRIKADDQTRPDDDIQLQVVWCAMRDDRTYGRQFVDLMSLL